MEKKAEGFTAEFCRLHYAPVLQWNAYSPHLDMCGPSSTIAWVMTKLRNLSKHTVISIMTMMNFIGRLV